ncbi:hypothetical protein ATHL_01983 [Anaerolinea thermolimosa]|nr:hypothetical protein ATHL_01983 [Anaerolinea thermolimosa]
MTYRCAICGNYIKQVRYDLCPACFKNYGITDTWVRELIRNERHLETIESHEIPFTDLFPNVQRKVDEC